MINVTTRIAVEVTHLPPFEFSWMDSKPQKPRSSLVVDDILPTHSNGKQLFERAVQYVMHFVPDHFPALEELKRLFEPAASHSKKKTKVVPMTILQRDEKYTDETIKILHDFKTDCHLIGNPQVMTLLTPYPTHTYMYT